MKIGLVACDVRTWESRHDALKASREYRGWEVLRPRQVAKTDEEENVVFKWVVPLRDPETLRIVFERTDGYVR